MTPAPDVPTAGRVAVGTALVRRPPGTVVRCAPAVAPVQRCVARPVRRWQVTSTGTVLPVGDPVRPAVVRTGRQRAVRRQSLFASSILGFAAAASMIMAMATGFAGEPAPTGSAGPAAAGEPGGVDPGALPGTVPVLPELPYAGPGGDVPVLPADGAAPWVLPWVPVPDPGPVGFGAPIPPIGTVPVTSPSAGPGPVADPVPPAPAPAPPAPSPAVPVPTSAPVPVPTPVVTPSPTPTASRPVAPVAAALLSAPLAPLSPVVIGADGRPAVPVDAAQGLLAAAPGATALVVGPAHPGAADLLAMEGAGRVLTLVSPDGSVTRLSVGPVRVLAVAEAVGLRATTASTLLVELWAADGRVSVAETVPA